MDATTAIVPTEDARSNGELIEAYIALRNAKKAAQDAVSDFMKVTFNDPMYAIEMTLMERLNREQTDSTKANGIGIAYKAVSNSLTHADKKVFRDYVMDNQAWHLVDWTASKSAVVEALEQGQPLPPGLNFSQEYTIQVRKA